MKKYFIAVLLALIVATPVYAYTVKSGDIPYGLWGINWRTELAKYGITDPRKLPVGLEVETEFMEVVNDGFLGATISQRPTEFKTNLAEQKTEGHSGTTLKVTSITTKDGNTLDPDILGSIIVLSVNPGASNSETVLCTGLTTATKTFTGCTFGYRFDQPTATSSANIEAHSPGEPVIISNTDTYNAQKFITVDGDTTITASNTISGLWTFTHSKGACLYNSSFCIRADGSNLQWTTDGFTNSYNFATTSVVTLSASTTQGILINSSQISINASTTQGMAFGVDGQLYVKTSSTLGVYADSNGISINTSTLVNLIATSTATANKIPVADSSGILNSWVTGDRLIKINLASSTLTGNQTQTLLASTTLSANSLTTSTIYKIKINISNHTVANPITDSFVLKLGGIGIVTTTFSGASANPSVAGTIEATIYTVSSTAQKGVLSIDMMTTPVSTLATTNGFVEKATSFGTASQNTANSLDFGIYYTGATGAMTIDSYEITKLQL